MARTAIAILIIMLIVITVSGQSDSPSGDDKYARLKLVRQYLKQAAKDAEAEQYQQALANLDSVFAIDEKNADAFYYKSLVFVHSGDTASATELLEKGSSKAPLSARIKLLLARLYLSAGQTDKAAPLINSVLAIKPRMSEALYLQGVVRANQADSAAAIESLTKALDIALTSGGKL